MYAIAQCKSALSGGLKKLGGLFFSTQRGLPRPIWTIFWVQVVNRVGDFVSPFITLLFTRKIGLPESTVGLLVTATVMAGMVGNLAAGKLCDRLGRKMILVSALFFVAVLNGACGFIDPGLATAGVLVAAGFFNGAVRPTIAAMLVDLSTPDTRRRAWSLSYLGINIGAAVGPSIAGFLFENHLSWMFWADSLSTFGAIGLALAFLPESKPDPERIRRSLAGEHPADGAERAEKGSALAAFLRRPILVAFCAILLFINFIYGQTHFGLPLYTQKVFGGDGAKAYGILMTCNGIVVLLCTNPLMHLTSRLSCLKAVSLGAALYGLGFAAYAFRLPLPVLCATTALWTLGEILFVTNSGAWVASRTPMNLRGRFQAIQGMITSSGFMLSPLLGGLMAQGTSVYALWALIAALAFGCAGAFRILERKDLQSGDACAEE